VATSVLDEHHVVLTLATGYIAIGGLVLTILGRPWAIQIMNWWLATVWALLSVPWLVWQLIRGRLRAAIAPQRLGGVLVVALLALPVQITFQSLKQSIGPVLGFRNDEWLHRFDVTIHGGAPWQWLGPIVADPGWIRFIDRLYLLWFAGLITFVVWAGWTKFRVLRQRALVSLLLLWIGGGTIGAWAASSVGPCYYREVVQGPNPYEQLLAQLDSYESPPVRSRMSQLRLWETRRADQWAQFAGISAMPSMHVALAVLFALVAWQCSRVLGLLLWGYALIIQVGSVVLAWHYAIDGYVGALVAIICWLAAPSIAHAGDGSGLQTRGRR
jgi:membrane-associated phospholipid phosphatase